MTSILKKLNKIQTQLKAPKGQFNSFGKYNYRNSEDILEALKPLLASTGCAVNITDDIRQIGNRYYIESTVTLLDSESGESIFAKALARESEDKKGMDTSQLTGATSSYARKYALNGLFAIDDTKDADSQDNTHTPPAFTDEHREAISDIANLDDLKAYYMLNKGLGKEFASAVATRKAELLGQNLES